MRLSTFGARSTSNTRIASGSRTVVPSNQNLLIYSEDLSQVVWSAGANFSSTYDQGTAPDGTVTADLLVDGVATGQHYRNPPAFNMTPGYWTSSVFLKAGTGRYFKIISSGTSSLAIFDLVGGVITSTSANATSAMISVGNGWYRCSITVSATVLVANAFFMMSAATGTDAYTASFAGTNRTYYWWGAQVVKANWAGPYAKTTSAAINTGNIRNIA